MKSLILSLMILVGVAPALHADDTRKATEALSAYSPLQVAVVEHILSVVPNGHVDSQQAAGMINNALVPYVHLGEAKFNDFDTIKIGVHYFDFGMPFGQWCSQRGHLKHAEFSAQLKATLRK